MRAAGTMGVLAIGLVYGLPGCQGGSGPVAPTNGESNAVVPAALLAESWQVRMSRDEARAPFEAQPGWALLFQREPAQALAAFAASQDKPGMARVHVEMAAFYRQAALLAASAAFHTFGDARAEEDPAEVDYLLAVQAAFRGQAEPARAALGALGADIDPAVRASADAWAAFYAGGGAWPPDAALAPLARGIEVKAGEAPDLPIHPSFRLRERTPEARPVELGDPTALYLLSRAHEARARELAGPEGAVVDLMLATWRLPAEVRPPVPDGITISDPWLFGGFALTGADLVFLADAAQGGVGAVDRHAAHSPLAAAIVPAIVDGQVVPDRMLDQAAWLGQQVEAAMAEASGGEQGYHPPFARLAVVASLRAAMVVADANDQYRDAGILRVNALDRSIEAAADPVFLGAVAAWDAGNRNALRAQELVHRLHRRYPALQAARYSLDALHIRTSRNAAPAAPVH